MSTVLAIESKLTIHAELTLYINSWISNLLVDRPIPNDHQNDISGCATAHLQGGRPAWWLVQFGKWWPELFGRTSRAPALHSEARALTRSIRRADGATTAVHPQRQVAYPIVASGTARH